VCLLEDHENVETILTDTLMEAGTKADVTMFSKVTYTLAPEILAEV